MKSITYVSKVIARQNGASVPVDLSKIYSSARHSNLKTNVTGVLSYRVGHYIQILEGDDEIINGLYAKIAKDNRHSDPVIIFNNTIHERMFKNWSMKLLQSIHHDSGFNQFINDNQHLISELSIHQKNLLNKFCIVKQTNHRTNTSFKGKTIGLSRWPSFTSIEQTSFAIELCSTLIQSPKRYDDLIISKTYGSQTQIDMLLNEFSKQEALIVNEIDNLSNENSSIVDKTSSSFYSKMKSFLGLGRSHGL